MPASWLSKSADEVGRRAVAAFAKRYNKTHPAAAPLVAEELIVCRTNDLDEVDDCDLRGVARDALVLVARKPAFVEAAR